MGKQRRQRRKFHQATENPKPTPRVKPPSSEQLPLSLQGPNIFSGLKIDVSSLSTKVPEDDTLTVKSFKSLLSEHGARLTKRGKKKFRHDLLLNKLGEINKEKSKSKKQPKKDTLGDVNPLRDALPSLESLIKSRGNVPYKKHQGKVKGIEKANKRKKQHIKGVEIYKKLLKRKS